MQSLAIIDVNQLREFLAEIKPEPAPALLDRNGLAKALSCSASHIDNLRKRGLPCVWLSDVAVWFELEPCLAWLREHGGES